MTEPINHRATPVNPVGEGEVANEQRYRAEVERSFLRADNNFVELQRQVGGGSGVAVGPWVNMAKEVGVSGTVRCRFENGGASVRLEGRLNRGGVNIGTGLVAAVVPPFLPIVGNGTLIMWGGHKSGQGVSSEMRIYSIGDIEIVSGGATWDITFQLTWWL